MKRIAEIIVAVLLIAASQLLATRPGLLRVYQNIQICNPKGAWGVVSSQEIVILVTLIILFVVAWIWLFSKNVVERWGLMLVFAAGASNLYERLAKGCIIDYWKVIDWWPAFNLADGVIVAGIILLLINQARSKN